MSRLDLVIFGATGFTGKWTVIHMIEFAKKYKIGSWGVAGRSRQKIDIMLKEVADKTGADISGIKVIIADVTMEKSLQDMCSQTKVVANCCGPYRLYGEPVVKAAIDNNTHYVDVSGEPQFMELMQLRYNDLAREAGVFVISSCGWDSIPSDLGVIYLQQKFGGVLNSVRSYLTSYVTPEALAQDEGRGVINYGTWESLVYGIANYNELPHLRKQLYPTPLPQFKPKLTRQLIHKKDNQGKYYVPFLGSDESVVYRTQRYLYEKTQQRPIQFKAYVKIGNLFMTAFAILVAAIFFFMSKFSFTRNLLLKHPKIFSFGKVTRQGPTEAVMNNTHFTFLLVGQGWDEGSDVDNVLPNKEIVAKVWGVNPGYGATCVALLGAARALLAERERMPAHGGVLTTGAAFQNTGIINILNENNLKYEIVETRKLTK